MELNMVQSLGRGVTRIGARNVGWADVQAIYSDNTQGWDVEVQHTNVENAEQLGEMVAAFRKQEGLE